jgi:serine/threonine protein kinase
MAYLHGERILHRDLNCKNILIDGNFTAKVSDFGLSRMKENVEQSISNTMGAVAWMAPEIIQDPRSFTYKADVYSFGMVIYEMLTKQSPIPTDVSSLQLAQKILQEDYRPLLPTDLLPAYRILVQICWEKSPEKRPDFAEILNLLREVKGKLPAIDPANIGEESSTGSTSESFTVESRFLREIDFQKQLENKRTLPAATSGSTKEPEGLADSEEEETQKADDKDSKSFQILAKLSNRSAKGSRKEGSRNGKGSWKPDREKMEKERDVMDDYLEDESLDSSEDKKH